MRLKFGRFPSRQLVTPAFIPHYSVLLVQCNATLHFTELHCTALNWTEQHSSCQHWLVKWLTRLRETRSCTRHTTPENYTLYALTCAQHTRPVSLHTERSEWWETFGYQAWVIALSRPSLAKVVGKYSPFLGLLRPSTNNEGGWGSVITLSCL